MKKYDRQKIKELEKLLQLKEETIKELERQVQLFKNQPVLPVQPANPFPWYQQPPYIVTSTTIDYKDFYLTN